MTDICDEVENKILKVLFNRDVKVSSIYYDKIGICHVTIEDPEQIKLAIQKGISPSEVYSYIDYDIFDNMVVAYEFRKIVPDKKYYDFDIATPFGVDFEKRIVTVYEEPYYLQFKKIPLDFVLRILDRFYNK
jgi:hypothetical protein